MKPILPTWLDLPSKGMRYLQCRKPIVTNQDAEIIECLYERHVKVDKKSITDVFTDMFNVATPIVLDGRQHNKSLAQMLKTVQDRLDWAKVIQPGLFRDLFVSLVLARRRWELRPCLADTDHPYHQFVTTIIAFRKAVGDGIQDYDPKRGYEGNEIPSWIDDCTNESPAFVARLLCAHWLQSTLLGFVLIADRIKVTTYGRIRRSQAADRLSTRTTPALSPTTTPKQSSPVAPTKEILDALTTPAEDVVSTFKCIHCREMIKQKANESPRGGCPRHRGTYDEDDDAPLLNCCGYPPLLRAATCTDYHEPRVGAIKDLLAEKARENKH
ncbi:hypothetical protein GGR57DRAFT_517801 [Xylariaceae sp. FL1272]|nr:hypothetical protein GGR57DRAFT_517801 [Xylariaceae sp. FL1272]